MDDDGTRRCRWCARPFPVSPGPGRPREFCRRSCRQRDYEARRRSEELGLSENDLVVARRRIDVLRDRLYVLECALEDVARDLDGAPPTGADYQEALHWVVEAATPLLSVLDEEPSP